MSEICHSRRHVENDRRNGFLGRRRTVDRDTSICEEVAETRVL